MSTYSSQTLNNTLAYLMNEEYKAFLIEDYRKVLNEILGLDFDYEIKNNNYETVS